VNEIKRLVEAALAAKKQYGASSKEYTAAQNEVFVEINKIYKAGDKIRIEVTESSVLNAPVSIEIEKHGEGARYCSFVLAKPK
jgi:hypothetical protein